jgi:hypothetical protein
MLGDPSSDPPHESGRKADGTFAPGNKAGKGYGRPLGARDKATQMVDKLLYSNVRGIAEVLVREARAGQHWAVKAAPGPMLPWRSRKVSDPVEQQPVATVEEAAERFADILARMEVGSLDLDEGATLISGLQAFMGARSIAELEREAVEMRQEIIDLRAMVEEMTRTRRAR